jgi:hypothetical protein
MDGDHPTGERSLSDSKSTLTRCSGVVEPMSLEKQHTFKDSTSGDEDEAFIRPVKRRKKLQKIKITLHSNKECDLDQAVTTDQQDTAPFTVAKAAPLICDMCDTDDESLADQQMEDTLDFFQETHEEQDPEFAAFERKNKYDEWQKQLNQISLDDIRTRRGIDVFITEQVRSKQAGAEKGLDKYRQRAVEDEKRDSARLEQLYLQKVASNQKKINQGIKMLQDRNATEMQNAMNQHRQQAQHRRLPEAMANAEFQAASASIRAKQQRQMQDFQLKSEELQKKTEADYKREQDRIRQQYEQRQQGIEANRQKINAKLLSSFQQIRQRYLKRHMQKVLKRKEECLKGMNESTVTPTPYDQNDDDNNNNPLTSYIGDVAKTTLDMAEFRQPVPIKSTPPWAINSCAGAAARHKHRKTINSQTSRQWSVEIHNEGLWVSTVSSSNAEISDKKKAPINQEFITWGAKSHSLLESIVCGEIPRGYEWWFDGDVQTQLQGGQIRCMVVDLRTSEQSASSTRELCLRDQEELNVVELEQKATNLGLIAAEAEKAASKAYDEEKVALNNHENAVKALQKCKSTQQQFTTKFRNFFGPGT